MMWSTSSTSTRTHTWVITLLCCTTAEPSSCQADACQAAHGLSWASAAGC